MSLVSFCPSIVTVKQSFIVSQIVSCQQGPYDPTTATPMKTSLKNRLRVLWNFFALIPSHLKVGKLGWNWREGIASEFREESKIYRLADPVLTSTQNSVISSCSCALCPRHKDRSHRPSILRAKGGGLWRQTRELCSSPQRPQLQLPCYQYCSSNLWSFLAMQSSKNWFS